MVKRGSPHSLLNQCAEHPERGKERQQEREREREREREKERKREKERDIVSYSAA